MSRAAFLLLVTLAATVAPPSEASSAVAGEAAVLHSFLASLPLASRRVLRPLWKASAAATSSRNGSGGHCAFLGVECAAAGDVAAVNLSGVGLSGELEASAPRLCALRALATLDLTGNRFTGAVPAALAECSGVTTLLLGGNLLNGAVPPELLSSRQLRKVDLSVNNFTGEIPVPRSPVLEYLDLSVNALSGAISPELAALPQLSRLDLNSNNLSGPVPEFMAQCRLTYLSLFSNQIFGYLPHSLSNCDNLTALYLSFNGISGKVPDFFASMPNLQSLYLDDNQFTGQLPASIGELVKLEELVVSNNWFAGPVPDAIGKCQSLTMLYLNGNQFPGPIPAFIGNLSRLHKFSIADNGISGRIPPEIGKCGELVELQLQNNSLYGAVPSEISNLTQLQRLYLFNNLLHGPVPSGLWQLPNMVELYLDNNSFSGEVHAQITQMRKLREISLFSNNFTGMLPQALGLNTTPGLLRVELTGNHFHGKIPLGLCTGGQLSLLDLGDNHFSGGFPAEIAKCKSMWRFILRNNLISGKIPANLDTNIGLSYFDMSGNLLEGRIPSALGSWLNLTMFDFWGNKLSGPIPRELGALSKRGTLRLSSNRLTGLIPHELGNSKNLLFLDLGNNLLTGHIPAQITTLGSLQNLLLGGNNLNGTIPDSFTAKQDLIELQLGDNCLERAIPPSLGNLQYMSKALNISHNRLSGQIPSSLGNLQDLEVLDLSKNSLSGPIPLQLTNMISLSVVNVSFNELAGQMPASWAMLAARSPEGFIGNPQLCINPANGQCSKTQSNKFRCRNARIIVALVVLILTIVIAGLCAIHYLVKKSQRLSASNSCASNLDKTEELPEDLTYEDILRATDNWSEKYVIGRGRHGTVYRTECKLGKQWAVKTVALSQCKFPIEMKILNTIKHRNIIRMDGYCIRGSVGLMLYEYMPSGTLFDLLHARKAQVDLDWIARHQIALGIAQGLSYLHHDCVPMIVHRDVKSSNILMDTDLTPKLTDFGMGKIVNDKDTDATVSVIVGTLGYIAPEHGYSTRLSEKSDVYGYGVVLHEILFRKMPVDPSFGDGVDIVAWLRSNLKQEDRYSIISHMDEEIIHWPEDEQTKALDLLDLAVSSRKKEQLSRRLRRGSDGRPTPWRGAATRSGGDTSSGASTSTRSWRRSGRAQYGVVVKARHLPSGDTVAVKWIRSPDLRAVVREAGCLAACRGNPSVVQIRDVASDEATGDLFLVTELVPGPCLLDRLTRRFSERETRSLMRQLLCGVAGIHAAGAVHRDVKPENVLVGPGGALKICDFGMATADQATVYGRARRVAVLLTGEPLFAHVDTEDDMLMDVLHLRHEIDSEGLKAFKCLPEVSPDAGDLQCGLLCFQEDERLTAAEALRHKWFVQDQETRDPCSL
ncbi:hypothetical protein QOZ80_2AG0120090 [Eleusine coracana subsp. coracana]|nr:hypothetical protein QOZ80_2AG0120090 [Eleusine coracana subsp. coracana]